MKKLIFLLSLLAYSTGFSQITYTVETADSSDFELYESEAEFPGGQQEMFKFLSSELKYPQMAIENNISGLVHLKFLVEEDGSITDITILKGMTNCRECEQEAIRVIKLMPNWIPAKKGNENIRTYFVLPIRFSLI